MTSVLTLARRNRSLDEPPLIQVHKVTIDTELVDLYGIPTEALERKISSHKQVIVNLIDANRQPRQVPDGSPRPIVFTADISKFQRK